MEDFEKSLINLENDVKKFEISLRTAFIKNNPNNHIVVQRVNRECEQIKLNVIKILEQKTTSQRLGFKIDSVVTSARFYTQKFDEAIEKGILLEGDILHQLAIYSSQKIKKE